ncbi:Holliday junction resolvase RuvX [Solwaraspora sp. WMMD406]|uniref:Holliday junction resolvase RuvX n=1 Tax=Solwaraspora sp. WMMD406 TaxID=3016095 RepID=UPI0024166CF8|nr:Holliday junction resolvase RuvX [Solwaraspora sp. WMMD406]MDG4766505.1 Holliday junction resolvase RuvX [Solwaraspora sp. WMMD406]
MTGWARGRRLGVDVGQVRVGLAISDPDGILATPLVTVQRDRRADDSGPPSDVVEIARIVIEYEVHEVIVGLPVTLAGTHGPAVATVQAYIRLLSVAIAPIPVLMTDERMSTVVASRRLSERGVRGRRQRTVVDQAAAVEILQSWLDAQRRRM